MLTMMYAPDVFPFSLNLIYFVCLLTHIIMTRELRIENRKRTAKNKNNIAHCTHTHTHH